MTTGIYCITNLINDKKYIGQSKTIEKRWNFHKTSSFNSLNSDYNNSIHQAIRKYGLDNFKFEILEECKVEELDEKEKYWIEFYQTFPPDLNKGYNLTPGGKQGIKLSILFYHLDEIDEMLKDEKFTQKEIAIKFNVSTEMIQGINTGRYWKRDNIKYPIRNFKVIKGKKINFLPDKEIKYCSICGKPLKYFKSKICEKCRNLSRIKIVPSYEELFTSFYELRSAAKVAQKYKISQVLLKKWCKYYNINPQNKKLYIEKYEKEFLGKEPKKVSHIKKVAQIDPNTKEIINIFKSKSEAGRSVNGCDVAIGKAIKNNKIYKGYFWKLLN